MKAVTSSDGIHLLSKEQLDSLWTKFDANQRSGSRASRNRSPRLEYQRDDVVVRVTQPGGGTTTKMVYTRDISSGGILFLHPGFLYTGSNVSIGLRRRAGGEETANGKVCWCRHIQGIWHGTGVKFSEAIFPKIFAAPSAWKKLAEAQSVEPDKLEGQLLVIEPSEIERSLLEFMLKTTKLTVTGVADSTEAAQAIKKQVFDALVMDVNFNDEGASITKSLAALRAAGYTGSIVAMGVDVLKQVDPLKAMGINLVLPKPFSSQQLLSLLGSAFSIEGAEDMSPICSEMAGQDGIGPLLQRFCDKTRESLRDFGRAIEQRDFAAVRLFCKSMMGSGGGFGFPAVTTAAADAVTALDAGVDVAEAAAELQKLQSICFRLSPERKSDAAARAGR